MVPICGIAGIHVKDAYVENFPFDLDMLCNSLLLSIEKRGEHATGICNVGRGGTPISLEKEDKKARDFIWNRRNCVDNAKTVLLHTRFATQGDPKIDANNHPVLYGTCFAVHNGVINNDWDLMKEHEFQPIAEVDSIVIPAVISKYGFGDINKALEEIDGSMAAAIIDPTNNPDELMLVKGASSPLVLLDHKYFIMWASTNQAIENAFAWNIGTPPEGKAKDVPFGTILKIKDDKIESVDFDPYKKYAGRYRNRQHTSYSSRTGSPNYGWAWDGHGGYDEWDERNVVSHWCDDANDTDEFDDCSLYDWRRNTSKRHVNNDHGVVIDIIDGELIYEEDTSDDDMEELQEQARKESITHLRAVRGTAHVFNVTEDFVNWILVLCPAKVFENNPHLVARHEVIEHEYREQVKVAEMYLTPSSSTTTVVNPVGSES